VGERLYSVDERGKIWGVLRGRRTLGWVARGQPGCVGKVAMVASKKNDG